MFTVKVKLPNYDENIFEARRVEYICKAKDDIDPGVLIHYEDGTCSHYAHADGDTIIYVMNREGATVSTYRI